MPLTTPPAEASRLGWAGPGSLHPVCPQSRRHPSEGKLPSADERPEWSLTGSRLRPVNCPSVIS